MSGVRASTRDQRAAGLCVAGTDAWFKRYGLDYRKFCREGYPVEQLRATGDPLAEKVCIAAEKRAAEENSHG